MMHYDALTALCNYASCYFILFTFYIKLYAV